MLTESQLLNYRGMFLNEAKVYKSFSKANAQVSIFLSHSHKDQELVEGFINYLAYSSQIVIYVDWLDSDMPSITNRETAHRIKQKINDLDYFLVLATKMQCNQNGFLGKLELQTRPKLRTKSR